MKRCVAESNPKAINIEQYFTEAELKDICQYERIRLRNMVQNYEMMIQFGEIRVNYFLENDFGLPI